MQKFIVIINLVNIQSIGGISFISVHQNFRPKLCGRIGKIRKINMLARRDFLLALLKVAFG